MASYVCLSLIMAFTHSLSIPGSSDCLRSTDAISMTQIVSVTKQVGQVDGNADVGEGERVENVQLV